MSFEYLHLAELPGSPGALKKLWVPSEQVATYRLEMPAGSPRKWKKLIPWMLEEQLLRDPQELHFVLGPREANRQLWVASVPREVLQHWLSQAGENLVAMAPDFMALPWQADTLTILVQEERWVVRFGNYQGFAGDPDFCASLVQQLLAESPQLRVSLIGSADQLPSGLAEVATPIAESISWNFSDYPESFNLLTDEYRVRASSQWLRDWWPSMAAVTLCLLLGLALYVTEMVQLNREMPALEEQARRVYRAYFGKNLDNPARLRAEAERLIEAREQQYFATQGPALQLMLRLDSVLAGCSNCELRSIQAQEDELVIALQANDVVLTRLQQLSGADVQIEQDSEEALVVRLRAEEGNG